MWKQNLRKSYVQLEKGFTKMFILRSALCLSLMVWATALPVQAQERAAGGSTDVQMTWSALVAKVDNANAKTDAANTRIDQAIACAKKGKLYAPDYSKADASGCTPADDTMLNNILTCGDSGLIYDKSAKKCVQADVDLTLVTKITECGSLGKVYSSSKKTCVAAAGKVDRIVIINTPNKINCTQRVAIANKYVGHPNLTDYVGVPYSSTMIGKNGDWIISQGDGDCSPMSNDARWPIMVPVDADGKAVKGFYKVIEQ